MRSKFFGQFGIPDADCEIEPRRDEQGIQRLFFRSTGNPLVGLDLGGATKLRELMTSAGETVNATEIEGHIVAARKL